MTDLTFSNPFRIESILPEKFSVEIANRQRSLPIPRSLLRRLVRDVLTVEDVSSAKIELAFVDDPTIHQVNRDHLRHDYPTDVITFPYSEPDEIPLRGEIVISTDHAISQGKRFGHSPDRELLLYVIHGLLHLVGYDDHVASEKKAMHKRQAQLLNEFVPIADGVIRSVKRHSASKTKVSKKGSKSSRRTS